MLFYVCIGLFTWDWSRLLSHGVKRLGNIDLGLEKLVYASVVYSISFTWLLCFKSLGFFFFHVGFIAWQWKRSTYKVLRLWKNKRKNQNHIVTYLEHTVYCTCSNTQIETDRNGLIRGCICPGGRTHERRPLDNCHIHHHNTSPRVNLWTGETKSHYNIKFFNLSKTNE